MKISAWVQHSYKELLDRLVVYYKSAEPFERVNASWVIRKALRELGWQVFGEEVKTILGKPPMTAAEFLAKGKEVMSRVKEGDYAPGVKDVKAEWTKGDGTDEQG